MTDGLDMGRRAFLSRVGAGGVATGLGVGLLPDPPETPGGSLSHGSVNAESQAVAESDTPYAVYHYKYEDGEYVPTAPINVVFPLEAASFADVIGVFRNANWHRRPEEYARYAWDRATGEYVLQEWTATETHFGISGRYHVRCWETDGTASIQTHVDSRAVPEHRVTSYALGRSSVEELFADAGWEVGGREQLRNDRHPDHDGRAALIRAPAATESRADER